MKPISLINFYITSKGTILSVLLMLTPTISCANLIYQIDAQQFFDTDSTQVSGFVVWDELLSTVTNWHFETVTGFGVHNIATEGATFDANGSSDTMIGGETLQTFYTITPSASQEFEIIWETSPADASVVNSWSIKETWALNDFPSVHWRTGSVSVSLVSAVPLPASVWLFGSGLLGLIGLARRKARV